MMAAGAIMGIRIGVSLLFGAIFFYGFMAPILESQQIITICARQGVVQHIRGLDSLAGGRAYGLGRINRFCLAMAHHTAGI